eukprot:UN27017
MPQQQPQTKKRRSVKDPSMQNNGGDEYSREGNQDSKRSIIPSDIITPSNVESPSKRTPVINTPHADPTKISPKNPESAKHFSNMKTMDTEYELELGMGLSLIEENDDILEAEGVEYFL